MNKIRDDKDIIKFFCACLSIIIFSNANAQKTSNVQGDTSFYSYLELFETVTYSDSLINIAEVLSYYMPGKTDSSNPQTNNILQYWSRKRCNPFFIQTPVLKIKSPIGWYVVVRNEYETANIGLYYFDFFSFSETGDLMDICCLLALDEHGGLLELDEQRIIQGRILLGDNCIAYTRYEQSSAGKKVEKKYFIIDNNGIFVESDSVCD